MVIKKKTKSKLIADLGSLGDVKYSVLKLEEFVKLNGKGWVLMDGQSIENSKLYRLTGGDLKNSPDARGVFIRGMNLGRSTDTGDANGDRNVGMFQSDEFKQHSHSASGYITGNITGSNGTRDCDGGNQKFNCDPGFPDRNVSVSIQANGGIETRPRNISIYTYIKIN